MKYYLIILIISIFSLISLFLINSHIFNNKNIEIKIDNEKKDIIKDLTNNLRINNESVNKNGNEIVSIINNPTNPTNSKKNHKMSYSEYKKTHGEKMWPSAYINPLYISQENVNRNNLPEVLLVYISCGNSKFSTYKTIYPLHPLKCNQETNWRDACEGGLMLDFFTEVYDKPLAKKYIFVHNHDTSYHYQIDIWERLNYINKTDYFWKRDYGGLYCQFITFRNECGTREGDLFWYNKFKAIEDYIIEKRIMNKSMQYYLENEGEFPASSTFFVTQELIRRNPIELYQNIRKGLIEYISDHRNDGSVNKNAGIYSEYMWMILFTDEIQVPLPPDCKKSSLCF